MKQLSRLPLSVRLAILALATLCPVVVLTLVSYVEDRRDRREEMFRSTTAQTEGLARTLDNFALDLQAFSSAAALALAAQDQPISNASSQVFLANLKSKYEVLRAIFVTDPQGNILAQDAGDDTGLNLSSRPYVQGLQQGADTLWTGALEGLQSRQITVAFGRTIKATDDRVVGYLIMAFHPRQLTARLPEGAPSDAHILLLDQQGRVLISTSEEYAAATSDPNSSANGEDAGVEDWPPLQQALAGQSVQFADAQTPFDADKRFGDIVPLRHMQWALAYTRSQGSLNSSVLEDFLRDLAVLGAISVLGVAVLIIVGRQMTRPLVRLSAAADRMGRGEPVLLLPPSRNSDPDIGRLQRAFIDMSEAVKARETQLQEQAKILDTLEQVGAWIASDLDFQKTVQAVTDAGTRVTEAAFGAFFYNVARSDGEAFQLYTLSGVDPEAFAKFPMPRATALFGPTFRGAGTIRIDDVLEDPRYGKNAPYNGMPEGHLPLRSYLAVPVTSGSGEVIGGLFFGHPEVGVFTERHEKLAMGISSWASIALDNARLYEEANRVQEELRKSNQAKDEFLGLVSHELRTPTTTIYGGIRMLATRYDRLDPEMARELLSSVAEESGRLVRLIENLLAFARMEMGREIEGRSVSVSELVRGVLESFQATNPLRPLDLEEEAALPSIVAEPTYFEQVLHNLLSNAAKYSPATEPIEVEIRHAGGEVIVSVSDHGPGVPAGETEMIFESFYRSDGTSQMASGHGLGLTVCKRLVEQQRGRIWAENRPEGGLRVSFAFPAVASVAAGTQPPVAVVE